MTGCAICMNPFDRERYDRIVRLGYGWDFTKSVGEVLVESGTFVRDNRGRHGASWRVKVCTQCRYDLMGAIRRWTSGEFVIEHHRDRKPLDHDCPCCGHDRTQDGRGLRVFGVPGLDVLHKQFRVEDSVAILSTCQSCRAEFIESVLCPWLAGEFIADGRWINWATRGNIRMWIDPRTGNRLYRPVFWPISRHGKNQGTGKVLS